MASGITRDLIKTLQTVFSNPIPAPKPSQSPISKSNCLPLETLGSLTTFSEKHQKLYEADSQRLHEELLEIRDAHVVSDQTKLGPFLQTLRLLKPSIRGQARVEKWWDIAIAPVVDGVGHKKVEIDHAAGLLLDILENGAGEDSDAGRSDTSGYFTNIVLQAYLKRTKTPEASSEGTAAEDQFIAKQLEGVLVAYGIKKPNNFLLNVDRLLTKRSSRLQALSLLCAFVRHQPPQLYTVTQTSVIEHLIKSLMIDTSTTATSLALTTLIMFLPHIPSSVRTHLPRLFLIYSRLLCWERINPTTPGERETFGDARSQQSMEDDLQADSSQDDEWEKLQFSYDSAESTAPELLHFFTFLYGLYPLNFTSYVNKPRKYLKKINFPRAEEFDLDQALIRRKTEQFRRVHLLHLNFFNTTLEEEFEDDRWLKADPVEVVAECMGLVVSVSEPVQEPSLPGPPPTSKLPEIPGQSVNIKDIPARSLMADPLKTPKRSFSSPGTPSTSGSPMSSALGDADVTALPTTLSPSFGKAGALQTPSSTASGSPRVGPVSRDQMPKSPALRPATAGEANMAYLQREVTLLRSDLNYERYLKKQHLSHIGQLQRRSIKEATVEAETQNILNTNRTLKAQLAKANESYTSLKRETITGRSQSKKWEADLSTKVQGLKEDEKKWQVEGEDLRLELNKAQKDCEHLRQMLVDSESKELLATQQLQFAQVKLEQLDTLKARIADLDDSIRQYQSRELEFGQAIDEKDALKHELDTANLMIQGRDASQDRQAKNFSIRIKELEAQLHSAQSPITTGSSGKLSPQVQALIDSAVATINAKYYALKKEYAALRHKYVELDMRYQSLQGSAPSEDAFAQQSQYASVSSPPPRPTTSPSRQNSLDNVYGGGSSSAPAASYTSPRPAPSPAIASPSKNNISAPITAPNSLPSIRAGSPLLTSLRTQADDIPSPATQSQLPGGHRLPTQNSTLEADKLSMVDARSLSRWSIDSWDRETQGSNMSGKEMKEKIRAKDQIRVRGRGGAQNIGKKKAGDEAGGSVSGSIGAVKKKGLSSLFKS